MKRRAKLVALACATGLFAGTILAQVCAERARPHSEAGDLLYLPNEKLLNHFTAGLSNVVADLLWIQCVQYVAKESKGERSFAWLNHMVNTIVRLDPYFADVYRYGGMFLAALKADDDAGLDLIDRGIVLNPEAWQLPYEAAMIYLLNRHEHPDSRRRAALYLAMSAATGQAPPLITELAAKLQGEYSLAAIEQKMWEEVLNSDDKVLRDLAERKLLELNIRETCRVLNERMDQYRQAHGRAPASLAELGLKTGHDGLGGHFMIDATGRVDNTTLLNEDKTHRLSLLRDAIKKHYQVRGQYPATLEDVLETTLLTEIPPHPYQDQQWQYAPKTGEVH